MCWWGGFVDELKACVPVVQVLNVFIYLGSLCSIIGFVGYSQVVKEKDQQIEMLTEQLKQVTNEMEANASVIDDLRDELNKGKDLTNITFFCLIQWKGDASFLLSFLGEPTTRKQKGGIIVKLKFHLFIFVFQVFMIYVFFYIHL